MGDGFLFWIYEDAVKLIIAAEVINVTVGVDHCERFVCQARDGGAKIADAGTRVDKERTF